jgi:hypothetical protein
MGGGASVHQVDDAVILGQFTAPTGEAAQVAREKVRERES